VVKEDILVHFQIDYWENAFILSAVSMMFAMGFSEMPFIRLKKFPYAPSLLNVLLKDDGLFQMLFLHQ
jgi:hypothetical protein